MERAFPVHLVSFRQRFLRVAAAPVPAAAPSLAEMMMSARSMKRDHVNLGRSGDLAEHESDNYCE